jgi:hypothetical protein
VKFEIYCDESHPDVFWSESPSRARYLLIGGLWLPSALREEVKNAISRNKQQHGFHQEIKWHKLHAGRGTFYNALVDTFLAFGEDVRFRCIAVEGDKVDMVRFHDSDSELGFYKFYYQLIKHWLFDFNEYHIFCDEKTNRAGDRLKTLRRTLDRANITSKVVSVQALPSREVVLLQLTDFLLGMASSRMNQTAAAGSAKDRIIRHLEDGMGKGRLEPTRKFEPKFNIFRIDLQGGW